MFEAQKNQKIKKALVITGINGFPGKPLLKWADKEIASGQGPLGERYSEVIALDITAPRIKLSKTRFFRIDITKPSIDQKIAEIFENENVGDVMHLAFRINPTKDSNESHELHSIGTMNLLNACAKQKVGKIIVNSTTYCYGAFPNNPNFLTEEHPLRGGAKASYIRDRVDVEKQMQRFEREHPECVVTILRPCATLGPHINNFATRYLSRFICLTPLGYDPLMQLVHEEDVLQAFKLAIEKNIRGVFNIVGDGVLPLITLLQLAGRVSLPIANFVLHSMVQTLWQANVAVVPPGYLDYLRYLWVCDGSKAKSELGFQPKYSTKDTLLNFIGSQRLKEVHLANESL